MPSEESPSPVSRPPINRHPSTANSRNIQSSSPSTTPPQKAPGHKAAAHRPHVVGAHRAHTRNTSYGKSLNKLHRLTLSQDAVAAEKEASGHRTHQRKKSGAATPSTSPRGHFKRNSSNVSLNRDGSNVSLKKNQSNVSLKRNASGTEVKRRGGLHRSNALPRPSNGKKTGFEIGDSDNEGEWTEENSSQSPNTTRGNSRTATRAASHDQLLQQPQDSSRDEAHSPPESIFRNQDQLQPLPSNNQSDVDVITSKLLHLPVGSKAPPAMSAVSVNGTPSFNHSLHSRSYAHITHADLLQDGTGSTPPPGGRIPSSMEGGVSRFINGTTPDDVNVSSSSPMSSNFPLRTRTPPTPSSSSQRQKSPSTRREPPSRTQQKLWLQRAATESVSSPSPISVSPSVDPLAMTRGGSSSRGSRGRGGSEMRVLKKLYERANTELGVVRRYRNPVLDGLTRLDLDVHVPVSDGRRRKIESNRDSGRIGQAGPAGDSSRIMGLSQSFGDRHRETGGKVRSQRSEGDLTKKARDDDIGTGSDDEVVDGGGEELFLLRRLWGSKEAGVVASGD